MSQRAPLPHFGSPGPQVAFAHIALGLVSVTQNAAEVTHVTRKVGLVPSRGWLFSREAAAML